MFTAAAISPSAMGLWKGEEISALVKSPLGGKGEPMEFGVVVVYPIFGQNPNLDSYLNLYPHESHQISIILYMYICPHELWLGLIHLT